MHLRPRATGRGDAPTRDGDEGRAKLLRERLRRSRGQHRRRVLRRPPRHQRIHRPLYQRLGDCTFATLADAYFVDCGATLVCRGTPTTTGSSGLTWLEGETVSILTDGAVHPQRTVVGGSISRSTIQLTTRSRSGFPVKSDAQTLPISYQTQGYRQGRQKNVNKAWLRVDNSSGIRAWANLLEYLTLAKQRTTGSLRHAAEPPQRRRFRFAHAHLGRQRRGVHPSNPIRFR